MAKITKTDELQFRAALVADLVAQSEGRNVFDRRRSFNSRTDFVEKTGAEVDDETEIRYIDIALINIEDDPDEGPDDCPVANLTYELHFFYQFADARDDSTNSTYDFDGLLISLRSFFLDKREYEITNWIVAVQPITPPGSEFTQFGNDTFTDIIGHFKNINLVAQFYDK